MVYSLTLTHPTWCMQVFYAPHIARLSAALGARFEPIRYTLRGDALISNVSCKNKCPTGPCKPAPHQALTPGCCMGSSLANPLPAPLCPAVQVRYSHPLLGTGWLSASGDLTAADDTTLLLHFDRFWVDFGADALRP